MTSRRFARGQARSQVLRFWGENTYLGGKYFFILYFLIKKFLVITKFGGTKNLGTLPPNCPRAVATGLPEVRVPKCFTAKFFHT